jgi:transcriptional regulator with XRE-family HTH domain
VSKSIFSQNQQLLQNLLREMRIRAGLSQSGLATKLKRTQSFVSKMESGEKTLDLIELRQVCQALETSLTEFVRQFEEAIHEAKSKIR